MAIVTNSYAHEFDFPDYAGTPKKTYMIAATPRSGSTFLCMTLWKTGVLGAPMEYLNPGNGWMTARANSVGPVKYWEETVRRRTSPNGVFGFKMFPSLYSDLATTFPALLPCIQADAVFFLRRRDVVAQAVSYYKAITTKSWFQDVNHTGPVEYSFEGIREAKEMLETQYGMWDKIFEIADVHPHEVVYEEALRSKEETLSYIKSVLKVRDCDEVLNKLTLPKVQANDVSRRWADRFAREAYV